MKTEAKMKRVLYQFQIGLSLPEFIRRFGTEELCREHLISAKYPGGFVCRRCQGKSCSRFEKNSQLIFQCSHCHKQESLTSHTLFHRSKIPLLKWFCAFHLISQSKNSVSSLELHRHLDINYNSAWLMKQKIMEMMDRSEQHYLLEGEIELEEAYLGGLNTGKKQAQKRAKRQPFIAAVSISPEGKPLYAKFSPLDAFNYKSVEQWARENLCRGSLARSKELTCFRALEKYAEHRICVNSKLPEEERNRAFKWVDTILNNIKTSIAGTFHALDFERHGRRYLADLQFRFNRRKDLKKMFMGLIQKAVDSEPIPAKSLPTGLSR
jgi:hypothetical protein